MSRLHYQLDVVKYFQKKIAVNGKSNLLKLPSRESGSLAENPGGNGIESAPGSEHKTSEK